MAFVAEATQNPHQFVIDPLRFHLNIKNLNNFYIFESILLNINIYSCRDSTSLTCIVFYRQVVLDSITLNINKLF